MLYKKLESSPQEFYSSRQEFTTKITEFYFELGENIKSLTLPKQNEVLVILSPIIKVINNPQIVASYIVTHYNELMQKIDRMNDKKTASKLRHTIMVLSNMEIKELDRCIKDIRSWPYRGAYGINLYIERTSLFLNGGKSKYDGENFLGFRLHFRNREILTALLNNPQFKKLMTYRKELEFFSEARYAIKKSVETEGKWEGFYAFYNNLDENIRKVRDVYGNEQFAKLLEDFKKKKHEAPIDWENELYILYEDLIKKAYQLVVEPAENALLRIFDVAIKRLEKEKETAVDDLKKLMAGINEISKIKRKLLKILGNTRRQLRKELETERSVFELLMQAVLSLMPKVDLKLETATDVSDSIKMAIDVHNIYGTYVKWGNFTLANLRFLQQPEDRLENDDTAKALTAAMGSLEKEAVLASQGISKQDEIERLNITKQSMLMQAIKTLEEGIEPNLAKCDAHIESKLKFYTDEVHNYLNKNNQSQSLPQQNSKENKMVM